jgi:hypothetical protein
MKKSTMFFTVTCFGTSCGFVSVLHAEQRALHLIHATLTVYCVRVLTKWHAAIRKNPEVCSTGGFETE